MSQQSINLGTVANDGTGDSLRDAGDKINDNFGELYTADAALDTRVDALEAADVALDSRVDALEAADVSLDTRVDALEASSGTVTDAELLALAALTSAANKIPMFSGSGSATLLDLDTDGTLAANSDTKLATQKAVKNYVDAAVTGLLDLKTGTDCSGTPNYPAGTKGDAYYVTVAGKIGGASGKSVDVGDVFIASADNAGGTEASVGTSWFVLEHNLSGVLTGATATTTEQLTGTDTAKVSTPDSVAALWEQGADVASAGTVSLGEGGYFNITGTTTITDIDFATDKAGRKAWVKFAGALTLTHNASTLILPGGASIVTAAGDTACFVSEGSDVIRCVAYQRASGAAVVGATFATASDINTGTDTTKALNADALAGSNLGERVVQIQVTDPAGNDLAVADGLAYFVVPEALNGMNLIRASAAVITASTSGLPTIQLANVSDGVDMLSTKITVDANETDSRTAAAQPVIDTTKDDVATGDLLRVDCDVAGTGAKGLIITLAFQLP